jgi:hypothetical protein
MTRNALLGADRGKVAELDERLLRAPQPALGGS